MRRNDDGTDQPLQASSCTHAKFLESCAMLVLSVEKPTQAWDVWAKGSYKRYVQSIPNAAFFECVNCHVMSPRQRVFSTDLTRRLRRRNSDGLPT